MPVLTEQQVKSLTLVSEGADVYDYAAACDIRDVRRSAPELVVITTPQAYTGDGTDRVPYFGAILTDAGRQQVSRKS